MMHANQIIMLHNLNLYSALCYISIKLEEKWIIKCNCLRFENKEIKNKKKKKGITVLSFRRI